MQEALLYIATSLSMVALVLLVAKPLWGVMAIFLVRPLVDATWAQPLIFDFKLTELLSSFVPLIIFARMIFDDGTRRPLRNMPLKWIWFAWSVDAVVFSSLIMFESDWRIGLSVLMRHLNGLTGFYMLQAYCRNERDFLRFVWAMAIAGFFPVLTGLLEGLTGVHWSVTHGENDVIRNVGFYHDAITIRYFALQTILSVLLIVSIGTRSKRVVVFSLFYGLAAAIVVQGAYSKSGLLTLGLWILLWPLLRKNFKALLAAAVGILVVAVYFSREIMNSVGFVFAKEIAVLQGQGQVDQTFAGRWYLWKDLAKEWLSLDPIAQLFGAGQIATGAHNDYLQVLFHGGFVGLTIYISLLSAVGLSIGRLLWMRRDIWAIAPLFVFIMWIVDTIGLVPSAYSGYQWFVWGIIGFCLRHRQDEKLRIYGTAEVIPKRFPNLVGVG
jgi:O-antigen ligase